MDRRWYRLDAPPGGPQFEALLDFALARRAHYPSFHLVERGAAPLSAEGRAMLEALAPFEVATVESDRWPGAHPDGGAARVRFFRLERGAVAALRRAGSLDAFAAPAFPEDLGILGADKHPWLASSPRDGRYALHLSEEELRALAKSLPWLKLDAE